MKSPVKKLRRENGGTLAHLRTPVGALRLRRFVQWPAPLVVSTNKTPRDSGVLTSTVATSAIEDRNRNLSWAYEGRSHPTQSPFTSFSFCLRFRLRFLRLWLNISRITVLVRDASRGSNAPQGHLRPCSFRRLPHAHISKPTSHCQNLNESSVIYWYSQRTNIAIECAFGLIL